MFRRSNVLFKQSWSLLRARPTLMLFPLASGVAQLLVFASFAGLMLSVGGLWDAFQVRGNGGRLALDNLNHWVTWPLAFAFYFVTQFVIIFFNTALAGTAMNHFKGRPSGLGDGLSIAFSRLPQILGWTLVAATVGMILQAIAERLGFVGRIIIGLIGFAWAVATYFVPPILAVEGVGPITAAKRSIESLRKSFGESLVLNVGLGLLQFAIVGIVLVPLVAGIVITALSDRPEPILIGIGLMFLLTLAAGLVVSTLSSIVRAALYRFVVEGEVPEGFDREALASAFRSKKKPNPA